MAEIILSKVIPFNNGFVIESTISLTQGLTYYLNIDSSVIYKQYIAYKNGTIITDSWSNLGYTPLDNSNTCFTLLDTPSNTCPTLICNLQVS